MVCNGIAHEKYRRNAERYDGYLTDGEWSLVEPPVPPPPSLRHSQPNGLRGILDAIRYMLATG